MPNDTRARGMRASEHAGFHLSRMPIVPDTLNLYIHFYRSILVFACPLGLHSLQSLYFIVSIGSHGAVSCA